MNNGMGLFDSVPPDVFNFSQGLSFDAKSVQNALGLKKEDVSHLAGVSVKSVRYDEAMPEKVRERLQEIGNTVNLVAQAFDGNVDKTVAWFKAANPLLGDISPRDMIRLGRHERLRKFIFNAMTQNPEVSGGRTGPRKQQAGGPQSMTWSEQRRERFGRGR